MRTLQLNMTAMNCPVRHICAPVDQVIIQVLHVMLYFAKYNYSIPI